MDRSGRQFLSFHALSLAIQELQSHYSHEIDKIYQYLMDSCHTLWEGMDGMIMNKQAMSAHLNVARVDVERLWEGTMF